MVALTLLSALPASAQRTKAASPAATILTTQTTVFLQKYVNKEGKVNYSAIQHDPDQLEALVYAIGEFDVAHATMADQYAFYLNAYNVLVIGDIVRNYPLKSVQNMPGFFNKTRHRVGGEQLTLDQIETDKLRKIYDDPRLHFALVCGTQSCPRLNRAAYLGPELFGQLNKQTKFALSDPNYVKINQSLKLVQLPEIFKWYEADFSTIGKMGVTYVNHFRDDNRVPTWFVVDYYPYNWALNDQATEPTAPSPRTGTTVAAYQE